MCWSGERGMSAETLNAHSVVCTHHMRMARHPIPALSRTRTTANRLVVTPTLDMSPILALSTSTKREIIATALRCTARLKRSQHDIRDPLTCRHVSTDNRRRRMRIQQAMRWDLDRDRDETTLIEWDVHVNESS